MLACGCYRFCCCCCCCCMEPPQRLYQPAVAAGAITAGRGRPLKWLHFISCHPASIRLERLALAATARDTWTGSLVSCGSSVQASPVSNRCAARLQPASGTQQLLAHAACALRVRQLQLNIQQKCGACTPSIQVSSLHRVDVLKCASTLGADSAAAPELARTACAHANVDTA